MILIFDLDDTLYDERSFVLSGFRAVAAYGQTTFGIDAGGSFRMMQDILQREGRGRVFDLWLSAHGRRTRKTVGDCVKLYRHHRPDIALPPSHRALLQRLRTRAPLYLVTDGHKIAQQRKVEALGIEVLFEKVFITHRYGVAHAKPSLYCFEKIRSAEKCSWENMVYVGDNPAKDFVSLNMAGANTVRVLTGSHAAVVAKPGYDARFTIDTLCDFEPLLPTIFP